MPPAPETGTSEIKTLDTKGGGGAAQWAMRKRPSRSDPWAREHLRAHPGPVHLPPTPRSSPEMGAIETSGRWPAGVTWRSIEDPRPRQGRPGSGTPASGTSLCRHHHPPPPRPPPPPPATSGLHPGPSPGRGQDERAPPPATSPRRARDARCQARAQRRGPARGRAGAWGRPAAAHRGSPRAAGSGRRPTARLGHCRGAAAGGGRASPRAGAPSPGPPPDTPRCRRRARPRDTPTPPLLRLCPSHS